MEETIYKSGNIESNLEFGKIIKYEKNLKEIFSFLDGKKLFNLIIYNKHLQKILKINIEEYKRKSRKYKIGKKDGIGKVYILYTNILIFEGEYLNWKRNGKGKEYIYGKLEFEGEYLNGKRWCGKGYNINGCIHFQINNGKGKGKEYSDSGKLEFEGEYLNRERNGKGKEYNYDGKLEFEGEYLNGKRNGKGYYYLNLEKLIKYIKKWKNETKFWKILLLFMKGQKNKLAKIKINI